jgi:hypothetical protein
VTGFRKAGSSKGEYYPADLYRGVKARPHRHKDVCLLEAIKRRPFLDSDAA